MARTFGSKDKQKRKRILKTAAVIGTGLIAGGAALKLANIAKMNRIVKNSKTVSDGIMPDFVPPKIKIEMPDFDGDAFLGDNFIAKEFAKKELAYKKANFPTKTYVKKSKNSKTPITEQGKKLTSKRKRKEYKSNQAYDNAWNYRNTKSDLNEMLEEGYISQEKYNRRIKGLKATQQKRKKEGDLDVKRIFGFSSNLFLIDF